MNNEGLELVKETCFLDQVIVKLKLDKIGLKNPNRFGIQTETSLNSLDTMAQKLLTFKLG